jgi:hypothetical protein
MLLVYSRQKLEDIKIPNIYFINKKLENLKNICSKPILNLIIEFNAKTLLYLTIFYIISIILLILI